MECTPLITNDIDTPEQTLIDIDEMEVITESQSFTSHDLQEALQAVGYHQSTIRAVMNRCVNNGSDNGYGKDRPLTNIFYRGSVFTYPKLKVKDISESRKPGVSSAISLVNNRYPKPSAKTATNGHLCAAESNSVPETILRSSDSDALTILKQIRVANMKNVIIGQLNINSLRNKFYDLAELIPGNLDILVITETKLNDTFPEKQFYISGYKKPYRLDRNEHGGGIMIYVREDIPSEKLMWRRFLLKLI